MQTIKDPSLKPYYIGRDSHCYTVYEIITPSGARLRTEDSKGEDYEKPVAHYSHFYLYPYQARQLIHTFLRFVQSV